MASFRFSLLSDLYPFNNQQSRPTKRNLPLTKSRTSACACPRIFEAEHLSTPESLPIAFVKMNFPSVVADRIFSVFPSSLLLVKWYMRWFIYWTADLKSTKLWSSQLWTHFWTVMNAIMNSYERNYEHLIYHFTFIPHGLIRTQKWAASSVSGSIAQLVRTSHRYRQVTGSNPVEVLTFQASIRNCSSCVHNCEDRSLLEFTPCWHRLRITPDRTLKRSSFAFIDCYLWRPNNNSKSCNCFTRFSLRFIHTSSSRVSFPAL